MPISWQARITRTAISPRFAIRIFLNINVKYAKAESASGQTGYFTGVLEFGMGFVVSCRNCVLHLTILSPMYDLSGNAARTPHQHAILASREFSRADGSADRAHRNSTDHPGSFGCSRLCRTAALSAVQTVLVR